jgi:hypothetical protein
LTLDSYRARQNGKIVDVAISFTTLGAIHNGQVLFGSLPTIGDYSKMIPIYDNNASAFITSPCVYIYGPAIQARGNLESGKNYRVITDVYSTGGYADFYTLDKEGYATSYNGEEVMAAMINWVLSEEHKTAYFTQYHGEIVDIAFSNLLACAGYYIDVVDLRKNEQKMFDFYKKYGILFCGTMPLRFRVSQTGRFYVLILYAGSGVRGEIRDPR